MSTQTISYVEKSLFSRFVDPEIGGLITLLVFVCLVFGLTANSFLSGTTFTSIAFQLPELGLLSLAMLMPIISGGFNLAVTFTANLSGLAMAATLHGLGGANAGPVAIGLGIVAALGTGSLVGGLMGAIIAITGAHPILVSLSMMIFVRGLGEFLTRGGDISGTPDAVQAIGQGTLMGIPAPLLVLVGAVLIWHIVMSRLRLGFSTRMIGSNLEATAYSGISTRRALTLVYTLSGFMCGPRGHCDACALQLRAGRAWRSLPSDHCAGVLSRRRGPVWWVWTGVAGRHRPRDFAGHCLRPESAWRKPASCNRAVGRLFAGDHGRPLGLGEPAPANYVEPPPPIVRQLKER